MLNLRLQLHMRYLSYLVVCRYISVGGSLVLSFGLI